MACSAGSNGFDSRLELNRCGRGRRPTGPWHWRRELEALQRHGLRRRLEVLTGQPMQTLAPLDVLRFRPHSPEPGSVRSLDWQTEQCQTTGAGGGGKLTRLGWSQTDAGRGDAMVAQQQRRDESIIRAEQSIRACSSMCPCIQAVL
jgi:hypothetical protein